VPEETRQTGTAGTVIMRYVVRADGRVADIVPLNRHASPPLVDSVRKWLLSCRFQPAKNPSGELTDLKVVQPFLFKLR
jgi:TonB family protein